MLIIECHISEIKVADTVMHNGEMRTVCSNNIKDTGFMGYQIFSDSYNWGNKKVKKVIFPSFYQGKLTEKKGVDE